MKAIVRKELKRKAEDPLRPSTFRVRGRPVPQPRIDRYKRGHGGSGDGTIDLDAGKIVFDRIYELLYVVVLTSLQLLRLISAAKLRAIYRKAQGQH